MDKVNTLGAGIALAVTLALISALCAVAFVLAPDATLDFFGAFMHGVDLKTVKARHPAQLWKSSLWHYRSINRGLHRRFRVRLDL